MSNMKQSAHASLRRIPIIRASLLLPHADGKINAEPLRPMPAAGD
jgi:hypothetical protein